MRVRVFMSAVVATALFGSSAMAAEPSQIRYDNYTMCAAYMQEQVQGRIDSGKPAEADILKPAVKQLQTKALNQGALMNYSAERVTKDIADARAHVASLLKSKSGPDLTAFVRASGEHCVLVNFGMNGAEDKQKLFFAR